MNRTQAECGPAREAATIRPPDTADLAALGGFFAGLSLRSRVQRFFAPVRPSPAMIRLACGLGGPDGPASGSGHSGHGRRPSRTGTDALVATLGGVIIGHGMAVDRPADRPAGRTAPPEGQVTEIGVVVADAWQGQGVGSALVGTLLSRAQARGVTSLSMDVLPTNQLVLAMIAAHWTAVRTHRAGDCVTIQAALPVPLAPRTHPHPGRGPAAGRNPAPARAGRHDPGQRHGVSGTGLLTPVPAARSAAPAPARRPGRPPRPR
jgi:GNAT superfamily N-acetyltransferase